MVDCIQWGWISIPHGSEMQVADGPEGHFVGGRSFSTRGLQVVLPEDGGLWEGMGTSNCRVFGIVGLWTLCADEVEIGGV
jgi:hypothetical protein